MSKEWLKYPREFRLIDEAKESDPSINFGVAKDDIDQFKWNGIFHLVKSDVILPFKMECDSDFPTSPPKIFFDQNDATLTVFALCDDNLQLKPEVLNWDKNKSIYDHLKLVYGKLNK